MDVFKCLMPSQTSLQIDRSLLSILLFLGFKPFPLNFAGKWYCFPFFFACIEEVSVITETLPRFFRDWFQGDLSVTESNQLGANTLKTHPLNISQGVANLFPLFKEPQSLRHGWGTFVDWELYSFLGNLLGARWQYWMGSEASVKKAVDVNVSFVQ